MFFSFHCFVSHGDQIVAHPYATMVNLSPSCMTKAFYGPAASRFPLLSWTAQQHITGKLRLITSPLTPSRSFTTLCRNVSKLAGVSALIS